ncbi:sodium:proline symporter [Salicola sp. Rm-C-2C1-2]|uniref:sodium:solute symporter family transporter n=1 Tax=Salicola sp. Rm-C-2C1-2 TaxID=3141321 RepID=UPI0032E3EF24
MSIHLPSFIIILIGVAVASVVFAPRARSLDGFFRGTSDTGTAPGVWTLTLSQVTTWIFARSLLNAGILGYFFGLPGALAYTAYYGSFLTGWLIVDRLRFHHGATNVQGFLSERFGAAGAASYNMLVSLRLLTEVFANLLVVGMVFSTWGDGAGDLAIVAVAGITLVYSTTGGLRASLRTDVWQAAFLVVVIGVLLVLVLTGERFSVSGLVTGANQDTGPGWILLIVALLQVLSYPLHDPIMMDRGFLADRDTTRRSFLRAFGISALLILAFGVIGVHAGQFAADDGDFLTTLDRLLGGPAMFLVGLALVLSAVSTMDSTFSSVSKLVVVDSGLLPRTLANGRRAMAGFAAGGLLLVFLGTDDLYAAVAVSGTASLFLTPVIVFCIFLSRRVAGWSLLVNGVTAIAGAVLYFLEDSGYITLLAELTGLEHTYSHLLVVTIGILLVGFTVFSLGLQPERDPRVGDLGG